MMAEREWSTADHFVYALSKVREIDADVDNEHPHRHTLRCLRETANKVLYEAAITAKDIAMHAENLKRELKEKATTSSQKGSAV